MNLKSFTVKVKGGIHTTTNIEVMKKLIYKTDAYSEENRKGVLAFQGYLNNPIYIIEDSFKRVYKYCLVVMKNGKPKEILDLKSAEDGEMLLDKIWEELQDPQNKTRLVNLSFYTEG